MAAFIGDARDFQFKLNGTESFESYYERIELYFAANNVQDEGKKKATFSYDIVLQINFSMTFAKLN